MFWTIVDLMASLEAILGAAVFFSTVAEIPGERLKLGGGGGERTVRCPSCHRDSDLLRPLSAGADYDEPRPRFATLKEVLVDGGEAMVALRRQPSAADTRKDSPCCWCDTVLGRPDKRSFGSWPRVAGA